MRFPNLWPGVFLAAGLLCVPVIRLALPGQGEPPPIVINEVLADPPAELAGDANGDGVRDTYADEYIELLNRGSHPVDISGWETGPAGSGLYSFPSGTIVAPGEYVAVFGGGTPTGLPGRSYVSDGRLGSGLSNSGGRLLLIDPAGPDTLQDIIYAGWDTDAAWVREPEGAGEFIDHALLYAQAFSPAGPATGTGGPDQSLPLVYRLRIVNLTSSGFGVAWRTSAPSDGRLEVTAGGTLERSWDADPVGLLHLVENYGCGPESELTWRVVSGGTPAPADSCARLSTGVVVTSVPRTVFGLLTRSDTGAAVAGAQVFLRLRTAALTSGWLAARTDSAGFWALNLGNLRTRTGAACAWSPGDTLLVEADGGEAGVAAGTFGVSDTGPQQIGLPALSPDPPPVFSWVGVPGEVSADTTLTLHYTLTDSSQAWATLLLEGEGGGEMQPAVTDPPLLDRAADGTVTIDLSDLPEGSLWRCVARVEDGLNPPAMVHSPGTIRVAHRTGVVRSLPPGVTLFTPPLDDAGQQTAADLLAGLAVAGELARWDQTTAAWQSVIRLPGGGTTGSDFPLQAGEGYALVSPAACTLAWHGPRQYGPPLLSAGGGIALVGVSDSTRVRTASAVLADPAVLSVSAWDALRQAWVGCFRIPGGQVIGDDFDLGWGEAAAVEIDSLLSWQPRTGGDGAGRPGDPGRVPRSGLPSDRHAPAGTGIRAQEGAGTRGCLLAWPAGPGALEVLWAGSGPGEITVAAGRGTERWREPLVSGGWHSRRLTGLAPGEWILTLNRTAAAGVERWSQTVAVTAPRLPALPVWCRGPARTAERPHLLLADTRIVRARLAGEMWYADTAPLFGDVSAALRAGEAGSGGSCELLELADDGGWYCVPLRVVPEGGRRMRAEPSAPGVAVSGLEVTPQGPQAVTVRWQILSASEAIRGELHLGYAAPIGGGGPPGDDRLWLPAGVDASWAPGEPPGQIQVCELAPGPRGQAGPEALAVRIVRAQAPARWIGPVGLVVPEPAADLVLLPAVPNPFNPETTLRYRIPSEGRGRVLLEIRDVRGRRVRQLVNEEASGGDYQVRWDGRDSAGRRVAAGVYLVVLQRDSERVTRKILLLK